MKLVVIEPVSSGATYLYAAHKLGVATYIFSNDGGDHELCFDAYSKVDLVFKVGMNDFEMQRRVLSELGGVSAILPGVEYAVPVAAWLGALYCKNYLDDYPVEYVRNKYKFRSRLTDVGLSDIDFFLIEMACPVLEVPKSFTFPCVVKPVDMAGSICVRKVNDFAGLVAAVEGFGMSLPCDVGFKASGQFIVEEYIPGQEYSIEGIVRNNGSVNIFSITEKILGAEPYFVEIGHIVGQSYEKEFKEKLTNYALSVIDAIRLNIGPFHLELRVTPSGQPLAVELAARLPGDHIVELIEISHGVNLANETLCEYLDLPSTKISQSAVVSAIAFILNDGKDVYNKIIGLDNFIDSSYYLFHHIYYQPGENLSVEQDWTSRIGYIIFSGTDLAIVRELVSRVHKEIKII